MLADELKVIGMTDDVRKELIEYYKWIVTLATFVLTVSVSLVALFARGVEHQRIFLSGWVLLGLCVFMNWLLVKRLVTIPIVSAVAPEAEGTHHQVFTATIRNLKVYGLIQNWAFLFGAFLVGAAMVLNVKQP